MRTKELEVQFNLARYEREKKNAEAEAAKARHLHAQVQTFGKTESELRGQLKIYVDKFKQVGVDRHRSCGFPLMPAQVEDTLNNSNDLFLTFRKEIEEHSKNTRRLEKENEALKRKNDALNGNILALAQEREDWRKKTETEEKKTEKLRSIITQMQQQGRQVPQGAETAVQNGYSDGQEADDSDYSDDEDDEEGDEEELSDYEDEDEDDTEEEAQAYGNNGAPTSASAAAAASRPFGPERPPAMAPATTNGH
jgi:hypothetical protein